MKSELNVLSLANLVIILCASSAAIALEASERQPAPTAAKLAAAKSVVVPLYRDLYQSAKTSADREAVIEKILKISDEEKSPIMKLALQDYARELAARNIDMEKVLRITEMMAVVYLIDEIQLLHESAMEAASLAKSKEQYTRLIMFLHKTVNRSISQSQPRQAQRLAGLAATLSRRSLVPELMKRSNILQQEALRAATLFRQVEKANKVLEQDPKDPHANLVVGRYTSFVLADWESGLPHLAKCSQFNLATAASRELVNPTEGHAKVAVADSWKAVGASERGRERRIVWLHALEWYNAAIPNLSGIQKVSGERQIAELTKQLQVDDPAPALKEIDISIQATNKELLQQYFILTGPHTFEKKALVMRPGSRLMLRSPLVGTGQFLVSGKTYRAGMTITSWGVSTQIKKGMRKSQEFGLVRTNSAVQPIYSKKPYGAKTLLKVSKREAFGPPVILVSGDLPTDTVAIGGIQIQGRMAAPQER